MTNLEGILLSINSLDFSIFLLIDLETELEFFLGTIRKTMFSHVGNEVVHKKRFVLGGAELVHTKIGGGFTEELHLLFITKIIF